MNQNPSTAQHTTTPPKDTPINHESCPPSVNAPAGFGTFLRRPDPVFALRIDGPYDLMRAQAAGAGARWGPVGPGWVADTKHGTVPGDWGDYLVTDGKGDWWPVRRAIFEERYAEVVA